ncbi:MAG TPA: fumarylacetoacetate hydrolase family protein [Candidatus Nitrosopelagicus sp.]|jgi:2-keto-4-pentenoate hydratase/2-oxohepta-3-ene-1,7-dioic acid hydratase in catechol pathway|nr:fumarylacetoacetate hydrolase family protein [Candidatus Nitrosopelagicus sp.]
MKIVSIRKGERTTYGLVQDNKISTKDDITYSTGIPIPINVKDFMFDGWYDELKSKISNIEFKHDLSEFEILTPIPNPNKIICLAFNYKDHAKEQKLEPPEEPAIVNKPRTALNGTNSEIICPNFVKELDYEIELALIIGKKCKNITEQDAMNYVFGYMILNDVSARDIQEMDKQFTRAKSFDTFAPCGPWITTKDEINDPQNLKLLTKVNGITRQDSTTANMFIKIPSIISILSRSMTLEPGDIISTGTAAGVALNNPHIPYLKDGDTIDMEIEKLGAIQNTVRFVD